MGSLAAHLVPTDDPSNHMKICLDGNIDETAVLPDVPANISFLELDLEKVKRINSMGIKEWMIWTKKLTKANPSLRFAFENCPRIFIGQAANLLGFLPEGSKIRTTMLPFTCDDCDIEVIHTVTLESILKDNGLDRHICPDCKKLLILDLTLSPKLKGYL